MNSERFRFFPSVYRESDLLIGVSHKDFHSTMQHVAGKEQIRLHGLLSEHAKYFPRFLSSLESLPISDKESGFPDELEEMYRCGIESGTGPMSSVAGMFAEMIIKRLDSAFPIQEIVVENGGDVCIRNRTDLISVIHAGSSPLSEKMGLVLPGGEWGVCTSSGTLGHSYSKGRADAVTVVSHSTPLADAWATALANLVQDQKDIETVLEKAGAIPGILACVVIIGDRMGVRGELELKLLS